VRIAQASYSPFAAVRGTAVITPVSPFNASPTTIPFDVIS
jgi:hypothetical protein